MIVVNVTECLLCVKNWTTWFMFIVLFMPPPPPKKKIQLGKPSNPHCTDEDTKPLGKTQVPIDSK